MEVSSYRVEYNVRLNQGLVAIQLQDGTERRLNVNSDSELIIALQLLSKQPVDYDLTSGALSCGPRPVGT